MLCWADRLAVLWAFVVYGGLFLLSNDKGGMMDWFLSPEGAKLLVYVVGFPWLFLRLVDFVLGGPYRRRGHFRVRAF